MALPSIHVFWGTVENDSDWKISRTVRRVANYAPGCKAFALSYGRTYVSTIRAFLVKAIDELLPVLPRRGYYKGYTVMADGVSIGGKKLLVVVNRLVRETMEVEDPFVGCPGEGSDSGTNCEARLALETGPESDPDPESAPSARAAPRECCGAILTLTLSFSGS